MSVAFLLSAEVGQEIIPVAAFRRGFADGSGHGGVEVNGRHLAVVGDSFRDCSRPREDAWRMDPALLLRILALATTIRFRQSAFRNIGSVVA